MKKWNQLTSAEKEQIIKDCFLDTGLQNIQLYLKSTNHKFSGSKTDGTDCDGEVIITLEYLCTKVEDSISYRSIYADHKPFIKHILNTMAHRLAKLHFNINGS